MDEHADARRWNLVERSPGAALNCPQYRPLASCEIDLDHVRTSVCGGRNYRVVPACWGNTTRAGTGLIADGSEHALRFRSKKKTQRPVDKRHGRGLFPVAQVAAPPTRHRSRPQSRGTRSRGRSHALRRLMSPGRRDGADRSATNRFLLHGAEPSGIAKLLPTALAAAIPLGWRNLAAGGRKC